MDLDDLDIDSKFSSHVNRFQWGTVNDTSLRSRYLRTDFEIKYMLYT